MTRSISKFQHSMHGSHTFWNKTNVLVSLSVIPRNVEEREVEENVSQENKFLCFCNYRLIESPYFLSFRFAISDIMTYFGIYDKNNCICPQHKSPLGT